MKRKLMEFPKLKKECMELRQKEKANIPCISKNINRV
jgi:hypothetical protein